MMVMIARAEAEQIARLAHKSGDQEIESHARKLMDALAEDQLLTTGEAAEHLGVHARNTVKAWAKAGKIRAEKVGNRYMIPMSEILRLRETPTVRNAQALETLHAEIADLGSDDGMSDAEMEMLHQSRPGTLPWER